MGVVMTCRSARHKPVAHIATRRELVLQAIASKKKPLPETLKADQEYDPATISYRDTL